jgi:hypothetical protein
MKIMLLAKTPALIVFASCRGRVHRVCMQTNSYFLSLVVHECDLATETG